MSVREPGVNVQFVKEEVVHGVMSKEAGREVMIQKDFVRIKVAGNDKEDFFGPATVEMQKRFPEEWEAYQKGVGPERVGTPIRRWPQLTQNQVRNLESHAIYTVEDMASVADGLLENLGMGARKLREDAQRFLSLAKTAADLDRLDAIEQQNAELQAQNTALQSQLADVLARLPKPVAEEAAEPAEPPRKRRATA